MNDETPRPAPRRGRCSACAGLGDVPAMALGEAFSVIVIACAACGGHGLTGSLGRPRRRRVSRPLTISG